MKKPFTRAAKATLTAAANALDTPTKKWTWGGAAAGAATVFALPGMGLAAFGTAMALWWGILILPFALLGALVGHLFGLRSSNAELKKRLAEAEAKVSGRASAQ